MNQADWSATQCSGFLDALASQSTARTIHIVAHSMGSRVLAHALRDMDPEAPSRRFREIMLAAPDIDAEVFEGLAGAMATAARRVTIYASSNDRALWLSKFFNGARRSGDSNGLTLVESTDTIDASNVARGDWLQHSVYGDCAPVLDDMHYVMLGLEADKRAGLKKIEVPPRHYWAFAPTR
jgi:esterase/lipase superfamily enzyme